MKNFTFIMSFILVVSCSTNKEKAYKAMLLNSDNLALNTLYYHIPKWEGKTITNHPSDKGGLTNSGLTYNTYLHVKNYITLPDFYKLTESDIRKVIKYYYYTYKCNKFTNAKIGILFTELYWSGNNKLITSIVREFGCKVGSRLSGYAITDDFADVINNYSLFNQELLIDTIIEKRNRDIELKVKKDNSQKVFKQGWLNRNKDLHNTLNKIKYHIVKKNDTLYKISKEYNVSVKSLVDSNNIQNNVIKLNNIIYVVL